MANKYFLNIGGKKVLYLKHTSQFNIPAPAKIGKAFFSFINFAPGLKKLTAIFFFAAYLLSATEAHQLLKLPVVFQHFAEHQQENRNISFLQFLDMHYMHGSPMDKDHDRDMQLPFKATGDCIAMATAFVPLTTQISIAKPVETISQTNCIIQHQCLLPAYLSSIWQPPKSF